MSTFFFILAFMSLVGLIVGLVKPMQVKQESRKKVFYYFGGAFVILIILGSVTAPLKTAGENKAPLNQAAINQASTNQIPVQPDKPKEWQKVISIDTSNNKQSETFQLQGGQQKLIYKTTGKYVMCIIYLLDENATLEKDGGFPVVTVTEATSSDTLMRNGAGNYYLNIKTSENCNVEVQELK